MAKSAPATKGKRREQGEGSISARAKGGFQGSVELPPDRDGKRRRKYVYGATKEDVRKKLAVLQVDLGKRGDLKTSSPTVGQWIDTYMRDFFDGRPTTRRTYENAFDNYVKPVIGGVKLEKLTQEDVKRFHTFMRDVRGISGTTAGNAHAIISSCVKVAVQHDVVWRNVFELVRKPRNDTMPQQAWTADEARNFLQFLSNHNVRNASRYAFALLTGARAGECLGLRWEDVDFEENRINLRWQLQRITFQHGCLNAKGARTCGHPRANECPSGGFKPPRYWEHVELTDHLYLARLKTKAGKRSFPMIPVLRALLLAHREQTKGDPNPHGLVWTASQTRWGGNTATKMHLTSADPALRRTPLTGRPIDPLWDGKSWTLLMQEAGVRTIRRHDARHTAITLLLNLHVSPSVVKDIVGHSTIDMTEAYYIGSMPPAEEALMKLANLVPESMLIEAGLIPPKPVAELTAA